MANAKYPDLPAATSFNGTDVFALSQDLSGTPISRKANLDQLKAEFTVNQDQIYYWGKHGDDANDGLTEEKAFLTIGAANTAALAQVPSTTNRFVIKCNDAGIYTEDVVCEQYVSVDAPDAKVIGKIALADDIYFRLGELESNSGGVMLGKGTGQTSGSYTEIAKLSTVTSGAIGVFNFSDDGFLFLDFKQIILSAASSIGIGDITGTLGHTHIFGNDIYLQADGVIAFLVAGTAGSIIGNVDHIKEVGTHTGTTAVSLVAGDFNLLANEINCDVAIDVGASGNLNAVVNKLTGTITNLGNMNLLHLDGNSEFLGNITANTFLGQQANIGNIQANGNTFTATNVDGNLTIAANGAGAVSIGPLFNSSGHASLLDGGTLIGTFNTTGQLNVDQSRLDGSTLSSTAANTGMTVEALGNGVNSFVGPLAGDSGVVGLGDKKGMYVLYLNPSQVAIASGYYLANGKYYTNTATIHTMTSLATGFDWHYIYIDDDASTPPSATIIDSTTEPVWSSAKQGWYNGNDRLIGDVSSPDGSATVDYFETVVISERLIRNSMTHYNIALNMNPDATWQTPNLAESSVYLPVNAIEASINMVAADTGGNFLSAFTSNELAAVKASLFESLTKLGGYQYANWGAWGALGASRNIKVGGENDDDNSLGAWVNGYGYEL